MKNLTSAKPEDCDDSAAKDQEDEAPDSHEPQLAQHIYVTPGAKSKSSQIVNLCLSSMPQVPGKLIFHIPQNFCLSPTNHLTETKNDRPWRAAV